MLPTPAKTPSITSDCTTGFTPAAASAAATASVTHATPSSMRPCSQAPSQPKVIQNTSPMMSRNAGNAVKRPVEDAVDGDRALVLAALAGLDHAGAAHGPDEREAHVGEREKRSVPDSSSICEMMCSSASSSLASSPRAPRTSSSPSTSLVAAKRGGSPACLAWSSTRCMTAWMQRCSAPLSGPSAAQKSCLPGSSRWRATCSTCSTSSDVPSFLGRGDGHHGDAEHPLEPVDVDRAAVGRDLVHHVRREDHGPVEFHELEREVEVALDVGGVDDVDDRVGRSSRMNRRLTTSSLV